MKQFWQSRQGWPLKFKLAVYVALAFALGAAITAPFMLASMKKEIQREVFEAKAADAHYTAATMDREIALRLHALDTLSAGVGGLVKAGRTRELTHFLDEHVVTQSLFSRDIYVLSAAGERIAESPQRGNLGSSYRDAAYFKQAMASGKPVVKPLMGRFAKAPVIVFAVPLKDADGSLLGLLCGAELIGRGTQFDFSSKVRPGSTQVYHLISRPDALYVSSTDNKKLMAPLAARGLHTMLDRRRDGWVDAGLGLDTYGRETLSAAANLSSVDWYVVAQVSSDEAFALLNQAIVQVVSAVGLVSLAVALFLWLVLRRELLPIERAAGELNAVFRSGAAWSELPVRGSGEVRVLLQTLNRLHRHLDERSSQLTRERDVLRQSLDARERLHADLAQSESRYRALVVSSSQCVWRFRCGARSVDADSARWWCEFSGQSEQQRSADNGNGWLAAVHPQDHGRITAFWQNLLEGRLAETTQYRARRADAQWRWLSVRGLPIPSADGVVAEWVGTVTDVTEQRLAEDALRGSKASLEEALAERTQAEAARRRAEDATLAKSNFLANMSHEIRTPMNGILGLAYLLEKNALSADSRLLVQKIRATGANLLAVINDILDFSKIEAGHLHIAHTAFDLDEVLDHLATLMGAYADGKPLVLAIAPPTRALCGLVGDRLRLLQVLVNLTSNAIKFTPKGFVEVGVDIVSEDSAGLVLKFRVRDSGIGVPAGMQKHIFNPFEQADNSTTREFGGTGLGLSISSRLVGMMGGSLQLSSTVAVGSSFSFTLRFGKSAPAVPGAQALPMLRMLVAHESDIARQALRRTVLSLGCMVEALEAPDAVAARVRAAAAQGEAFDVLLLDGQSGHHRAAQLIEALCAPPTLAPWPVTLVLTDLAGKAVGEQAQLERIDAALSLPVSAFALRTAIHNALQLRAGVVPPAPASATARLAGLRILVVDDSEVNLEVARRILAGEGARVDCAADGAQALRWLQRHAGDVDMVLMDVQMPAMDGYQTTRKIRAMPLVAALPVVALTAGVSDSRRDDALAAGMSDFVSKPFDVEEIVALILQLTGRAALPHDMPQPPVQPEKVPAPAPVDAGRVMDIERAVGIWRDAEVYRKFLRKFVRDYRLCVGEMQGTDLASARARAHKLRGAAGSLVLDGIAQAAQALEHGLAAGADPAAGYAGLQQAFDAALLQIEAYAGVEPPVAPAGPALAPLDRERLRELLQIALQRLEDDSPAGVEPVLADLAALLPSAELLPLRNTLESYAFEACKRAVRSLASQHHIHLET